MFLTYRDRILNILSKEEQKGKQPLFTRSLAEKHFKNVEDIHGTIMRTARYMAKDNLLKRISPGQFKLTAKGRKAVNA